jgi:hypothetical protein
MDSGFIPYEQQTLNECEAYINKPSEESKPHVLKRIANSKENMQVLKWEIEKAKEAAK